jgi:predicted O-methyltransferase YrrM
MKKYDIPGWINNKQCDLITDLVRLLPDNSKILEIGTAFGRSSFSILDGMKQNQSLDVCDLWDNTHWSDLTNDPRYMKDSLFGNKTLIDSAVESVIKIGIRKTWESHVNFHKNSNLIRNVFQQKSLSLDDTNYDLVFLDGDHSYDNLYQELNKFKHVSIICGDDFSFGENEDVIKAVITFGRENHKFLKVELNSFFFILTQSK